MIVVDEGAFVDPVLGGQVVGPLMDTRNVLLIVISSPSADGDDIVTDWLEQRDVLTGKRVFSRWNVPLVCQRCMRSPEKALACCHERRLVPPHKNLDSLHKFAFMYASDPRAMLRERAGVSFARKLGPLGEFMEALYALPLSNPNRDTVRRIVVSVDPNWGGHIGGSEIGICSAIYYSGPASHGLVAVIHKCVVSTQNALPNPLSTVMHTGRENWVLPRTSSEPGDRAPRRMLRTEFPHDGHKLRLRRPVAEQQVADRGHHVLGHELRAQRRAIVVRARTHGRGRGRRPHQLPTFDIRLARDVHEAERGDHDEVALCGHLCAGPYFAGLCVRQLVTQVPAHVPHVRMPLEKHREDLLQHATTLALTHREEVGVQPVALAAQCVQRVASSLHLQGEWRAAFTHTFLEPGRSG